MSNLTIAYLQLSLGVTNHLSRSTHKAILTNLRTEWLSWKGFFRRFNSYGLGFNISTKRGIEVLEVKGPTISKRLKVVDYSIFLPEDISRLRPEKPEDIDQYLNWVFEGIYLALAPFDVSKAEIEQIKARCASELIP